MIMNIGTLKKFVSTILVAGLVLASATVAMAAEPLSLTLDNGCVLQLTDYVSLDGNEKHYFTDVPHDGIDAYDESFLTTIDSIWSSSDMGFTEEMYIHAMTYVGSGSNLSLSLTPDYQGEPVYVIPGIYILDDDGHISYVVQKDSEAIKLTSKPQVIFEFNNMNPLCNLPGYKEFAEQLPGKIQPNKLIYRVTYYKGSGNDWEQWDFTGFDNFRVDTTGLDKPMASTAIATSTDNKVMLNNKAVSFDAYMIDGHNYLKLRDVAMALNGSEKQFEVTWDNNKKVINLLSNKPYTVAGGELAKGDGMKKTAELSNFKVYLDGKEIMLTSYTINGNTFYQLRDLGKAIGFYVGWDGKTNTVTIDTSKDYTAE